MRATYPAALVGDDDAAGAEGAEEAGFESDLLSDDDEDPDDVEADDFDPDDAPSDDVDSDDLAELPPSDDFWVPRESLR